MTTRVCAVVLAGGASRRFGADKLAAPLGDRELLEHALAELPDDWSVILVGPGRAVTRPVRTVREEPPGSGPAAAIVAGVRAAKSDGAAIVVMLPGDAPRAGAGARVMVDRLSRDELAAVVAVDTDGRDQPLQLAVRGAALDALADAGDHTDRRARDLLDLLPDLTRLPLTPALTADIDTPADAARWLGTATRS